VRTARYIEELVAERRSEPLDPDGPDTEPHVVLLGDFDAVPDAASVRFWTGRQSLAAISVCYQDCWTAVRGEEPGHTFSPGNPLIRAGLMPLDRGRRIDYVLVRCGPHGSTLDVVDCQRVLAEPVDGVWASDHFAVLVDLRLPPHPPGTWMEIRLRSAFSPQAGGGPLGAVRDVQRHSHARHPCAQVVERDRHLVS
jgi:endonuclease/exonuclease/phosphatase family metal-dependent hydrolase